MWSEYELHTPPCTRRLQAGPRPKRSSFSWIGGADVLKQKTTMAILPCISRLHPVKPKRSSLSSTEAPTLNAKDDDRANTPSASGGFIKVTPKPPSLSINRGADIHARGNDAETLLCFMRQLHPVKPKPPLHSHRQRCRHPRKRQSRQYTPA